MDLVHGIVHQGVHQTVAGTDQHNDDHNAPTDSHAGQGRAQFVLPQGTPYFQEKIPHRFLLFEWSIGSEPHRIVGAVLLDLTDDSVLDVDNLIRIVGYSALVRHDNDCKLLFLI